MPLTLLDFILLAIMLVSGLLALMRGFTREVLSLVAWGAAGSGAEFNNAQFVGAGVLRVLNGPFCPGTLISVR